jgi:hypothetical protein
MRESKSLGDGKIAETGETLASRRLEALKVNQPRA